MTRKKWSFLRKEKKCFRLKEHSCLNKSRIDWEIVHASYRGSVSLKSQIFYFFEIAHKNSLKSGGDFGKSWVNSKLWIPDVNRKSWLALLASTENELPYRIKSSSYQTVLDGEGRTFFFQKNLINWESYTFYLWKKAS